VLLVRWRRRSFNKSKPLQIDDQPSPKYVSYEQSVRLGQKYFRY